MHIYIYISMYPSLSLSIYIYIYTQPRREELRVEGGEQRGPPPAPTLREAPIGRSGVGSETAPARMERQAETDELANAIALVSIPASRQTPAIRFGRRKIRLSLTRPTKCITTCVHMPHMVLWYNR